MNYTLVPMDRSHLAGVAELERLCFSAPWNEAMLEEELYNDTASFIVAEGEDGTVLGYAGLHVVLDEGYIDNVAVRPSCRRQGIADRLLDVFCRFGEANLAFLTLEVRPSNTAAVALYERNGFQEAGRRKGYYDNPKEDALLLTRVFPR
ncbi:MAG: ribosomal protein S18-alanine N-acetyltransferase [Ruminiclostridium sp.]|nr:ribosomal protein S18-alanine N-acetyltransferase [Ruminiclostridium sp.]